MLFEPRTAFPLAEALRTNEGAPIGEVFRFLSGLYFRGKLAYARRFAESGLLEGQWFASGALVITQNRGLLPLETRVCLPHLEAFAQTDIHQAETKFTGPLLRDARLVDEATGGTAEIVLLGSVASAKYVSPLLSVFQERLLFPSDFVGRGDMSRGGLLLRCVEAGTELAYVPVLGAPRKGTRPPKLPRRRAGSA